MRKDEFAHIDLSIPANAPTLTLIATDGGDGGKLANLGPGGRHCGAQDIGGEQEFQRQRQPTAKTKAHVFLRFVGGGRIGGRETLQDHQQRACRIKFKD